MQRMLSLGAGLLLALAVYSAWEQPSAATFVHHPITWAAPHSAPNVAAAPTQPHRVYLAIVLAPTVPTATIRFGTGYNDGRLIGESAAFAAGLTELHYEVVVPDGAGQSFREEWTINGVRRPELDRSGVIPIDGSALHSAIALSTGDPLPSGVYRLRFFVNGSIAGEGEAEIVDIR